MKKTIYISILVLFTFSCEDVIEIDLPTAEPKLVIDASINWFKGTSGNDQEIKLTLSAPYFDTVVPVANGAQITVEDSSNNTFEFLEEGSSGIYKNNTFIPVINEVYNLIIQYQGETFSATETLKSVSEIEYVEQTDNGGFSGEETELKAFYTDPEDEEKEKRQNTIR